MKVKHYLKILLPLYILLLAGGIGFALFASRTVTVMVETAPYERHCVVIDAGHGGIDGGATSCSGVLESQINLDIALRLNDLVQFLGYNTKMIRTTDTSVYTEGNTIAAQKVSDLKQRVKTVNETENGILVSIHQNTFSDGRYSGAQVFYCTDPNSESLATALQDAIVQTLNPGSQRKCRAANGIYLMQHIDKPGILIECGFLTNPQEDAKLNDPEYQKQLSCVIAATISRYLNENSLSS